MVCIGLVVANIYSKKSVLKKRNLVLVIRNFKTFILWMASYVTPTPLNFEAEKNPHRRQNISSWRFAETFIVSFLFQVPAICVFLSLCLAFLFCMERIRSKKYSYQPVCQRFEYQTNYQDVANAPSMIYYRSFPLLIGHSHWSIKGHSHCHWKKDNFTNIQTWTEHLTHWIKTHQ